MTERILKPVRPAGGKEIEFIRPSQLAEEGKLGVVAEGVFIEALPNHYDEAKYDYKIENENGKTIIINHTGSLAYQMKEVNPGTYVQISYNGKQTIEAGKMKGKEAHNFTVLAE